MPPLRAVHNQWTRFEEFPRFMDGVEAVHQEGEFYFQKRKTETTASRPLFESKMRPKMDAEKSSVEQAMEGQPLASWASIFLDYFDLKARLLAVESREVTGHFVGLLVLLGIVLVLALCSVLMYGAFLLYLVALLFHLAWGWSALICGVILTLSGIVASFLLRIRLRKPIFQMSLKDLERDKEWLTQSKTKAP
jgi:uncharacterized membrane protein YqjE